MDEKDTVALLSRFEQINFDEIQEKSVDDLASDLSLFLSSDQAAPLLKQRKNDSFLAVLRLFLRVVLSDSPGAYRPLAKFFDVILNVLRSKLPAFKKISRWQAFEIDFLAIKIPKLTERFVSDDSWAETWCFLAHILVTDGGQTPPVNALLGVTESAFRKGKENPAFMEQAWTCWMSLIDAHRNLPTLIASRRLGLLLKPLKACHVNSVGRIDTWVRLVDVHLDSSEENLKKCVDPLLSALYKSSKAMSPQLPDECADTLARLLSMAPVRRICLEVMIQLFKDVLNSNPSEDALAKTCVAFAEAVNACEDDTAAFNHWKSLIDQCSGSRASQARCILCQKISFTRWFDNSKINPDTLLELMEYREFREKILLPTIETMDKLNDVEPPSVKKKKSNVFSIDWYSLCDLYISWSDKQETADTSYRPDEPDHQAIAALLLHPFQNCSWNPLIANKWQILCQICHKCHLLESTVEKIFETAANSSFEVQRAVDILNFICRLNSTLCSKSTGLLEKISSKIDSVELKSLNDMLYVVENVSTIPDLQPALIKLLKSVNDASNRFDDSLRIRIKVAKLTRKIEPLNSLVDAEQTNNKPQRPPFRTQSNFQHRLSKAEEKKKFKMSLGPNRLFSPETNKLETDGLENNFDSSQEKAENSPINPGSSPVPKMSISPELIDGTSPICNNQVEGDEVKDVMVAEKENLNIPTIIEPLFSSSPSLHSSANKMKITNARELKVADGLSPTIKVKPVAGQKSPGSLKVSTPKVSYFDDDASDCVMVAPKPKTTPLTEHQKEMMSKRRTDIPALYQDLSQDTQISADQPSSMIIENTSEPVTETQSQNISSTFDASAPITHTSIKKSCNSAKKLDFNSPLAVVEKSSNTSKDEPVADSPGNGEKSSTQSPEEIPESTVDIPASNSLPMDIDAVPLDGNRQEEDIVSSSILETTVAESKNEDCPVENETPIKKRKRKSEPNKFSPKQTRSRKNKNLNSSCNVSSEPKEEEVQSKKARLTVTAAPDKEFSSDISSAETADDKSLENQEPEDKLDLPTVTSTSTAPDISSKPSQEEVTTPKSQKKTKTSGEVVTDDSKKLTSSKKKKKLFRLTPSNNKLENWLIRPDKASDKDSLPVSTEVESVSCEAGKEPTSDLAEPLADSVELSSQDIVPGTQDLSTPINPLDVPLLSKVDQGTAVVEDSEQQQIAEQPMEPDICTAAPTIVDSNETRGQEEAARPKSTPKNEQSTPDRAGPTTESPISDDIELIITSPTHRGKRASSIVRDSDKETLATENICDDWSPKRMRRSKTGSSPVNNTRLALHPAAGRSAKMLRLLVASNREEGSVEQTVTPVRRRESIVPQTFGENWPKGPTQDWVARIPGSPYMSPLRSTLKKTPVKDEEANRTPHGRSNDSYGSPLLSSIKKKRVKFFDPVVTTGLLTYEDGTGALHLADVSDVPIPSTMLNDKPVEAPPVTADQIDSIADSKDEVCPARENKSTPDDNVDRVLKSFQQKFNLDAAFVEEISRTPYRIQGLLFDCFNSRTMQEAIDDFRVSEYKQLRELPYSLLRRVENAAKENLADVLLGLKQEHPAVSIQTDPPPLVEDKHTHTSVPVSPASCQTDSPVMVAVEVSASPSTCSISTSAAPAMATVGTSAHPLTADAFTQADISLPSDDDLRLIVGRDGFARTLRSLSNCLNVISRFAPE
ncbi:Hypothetical protein NTJ_05894 [Nesidiocoris tenuis]|uniref:Telomere-associated protein Rif1 N-terminal domain-containing protein n=1 Tax=Nesidiocoris tenuis TaxID=355587 RepID=A0ABN7ALH7_9HEMI|nr:Hypothetical protein NTJ_05894 [Nesidiocoris tenuis]